MILFHEGDASDPAQMPWHDLIVQESGKPDCLNFLTGDDDFYVAVVNRGNVAKLRDVLTEWLSRAPG